MNPSARLDWFYFRVEYCHIPINNITSLSEFSFAYYFTLVLNQSSGSTKPPFMSLVNRMRENCERKSDPTFAAIQALPHQSSRRISVSGLLF